MRNRLQWWLPMAAKFDIVFSKELGNFDRYGMHGVNCIYLDQAVDPMEMPLESTSARKTTDIAFFGRWTPNRQESLSQISGNAQVTTYSVRPNAWRRSAFRSLAHVDGVEFAQAVSSARVIWGESATHDVAGYWSDRRYKVMGRGGTFVTRYTEGIDKAFTNNENILWYRSLEEAEDLVHSLLQDEPRIASIGVEAARHVHTNHTYDHRAAEMLQVLTA
ncbi:MAG: glycosyltransferase [Actinomycetia bacterium]|nr:glycosyltransferase [Actinomycetes bacterium]